MTLCHYAVSGCSIYRLGFCGKSSLTVRISVCGTQCLSNPFPPEDQNASVPCCSCATAWGEKLGCSHRRWEISKNPSSHMLYVQKWPAGSNCRYCKVSAVEDKNAGPRTMDSSIPSTLSPSLPPSLLPPLPPPPSEPDYFDQFFLKNVHSFTNLSMGIWK